MYTGVIALEEKNEPSRRQQDNNLVHLINWKETFLGPGIVNNYCVDCGGCRDPKIQEADDNNN